MTDFTRKQVILNNLQNLSLSLSIEELKELRNHLAEETRLVNKDNGALLMGMGVLTIVVGHLIREKEGK